MNYLLVSFILLFNLHPALSANRMDPDDLSAHAENKTTLEAVLKIAGQSDDGRFHYLCSGTLVEKNIILTAAHCAPIAKEGAEIEMNDEKVRVEKVRTHSSVDYEVLYEDPSLPDHEQRVKDKLTETSGDIFDLAFIQIKKTNKNSKLDLLHPLPIARHSEDHQKRKGRVLIAGYGASDESEESKPGILRAGYQNFFLDDYSQGQQYPLGSPERNHFVETSHYYEQFLSVNKTLYLTAEGKANEEIAQIVPSLHIQTLSSSPMPCDGDSGSAAISKNNKGVDEVVGVSSSISTLGTEAQEVDLELNGQRVDFKTADTSVFELPSFLSGMRLIDAGGKLLKDFKIKVQQNLVKKAYYTSVFQPDNAAFIRRTLSEFKEKP